MKVSFRETPDMPRCCRKHLYHYASFRCLITSSNLKMMTGQQGDKRSYRYHTRRARS